MRTGTIGTNLFGSAAAAVLLVGLTGCAGMAGGSDRVAAAAQGQPSIPYSGVRPDADNQAVLDALVALNLRPYHTLEPVEARQQPTFADGVMEVMRRQGRPTTPPPGVEERQISNLNTPSYQENANAMPLNRAAMAWFFHHTARTAADLMDWRINLVAANLRDLPPVTIIQAQIDPLRSEGDMLVERLRAAGVEVMDREYPGTTHEFFGGGAVIADAVAAQRFAGERLRTAFGAR